LGISRELTRTRAQTEKDRVEKGLPPWGMYDSDYTSYIKSFDKVLPKCGLTSLIKELAAYKQRKLTALDLAGQGSALQILKKFGLGIIDAMTLVDFRDFAKKAMDLLSGQKVAEGNVAKGDTWSQLDKRKYDLIVCRPQAAIEILLSPSVYFAVFNRMYKALDNNGFMITQIPPSIIQKFGSDWIRVLSETPGLVVKFDMTKSLQDDYYLPELLLFRTDGAPEDLRLLKEVRPTVDKTVQLQTDLSKKLEEANPQMRDLLALLN
jgi:hypothetical protein